MKRSETLLSITTCAATTRYEASGTDMPVATRLPVRIDPALASRVVVIAQIVMLGRGLHSSTFQLNFLWNRECN